MADITFKDFQATIVTNNDGTDIEVSIECVDFIETAVPEEVCPTCIPNPKAIEPNWKVIAPLKIAASNINYTDTNAAAIEPDSIGAPYLNEKTCEYSIAVRTHYETATAATDHTGEATVIDAINNPWYNMQHYVEPAIRALLRYYGKLETDSIYDSDGEVISIGTVDALKIVTAAVDYYVPFRPLLNMTVLVTVPALNFDQIESEPEETEELTSLGDIEFELQNLRGYTRRTTRVFKLYQRYLSEFEKEYGGGLFFEDQTQLIIATPVKKSPTHPDWNENNESFHLKQVVTSIFDFIFSRGYKTRGKPRAGQKVATSIKIGFETEYSGLSYIKIIEKGCEDNAKTFSGNKIISLTENESFKRPTTLGYLAKLSDMNEDLLAREPTDYLTFLKRYTYPSLSVNYGSSLPSQEDESLISCISNNLNIDESLEAGLKAIVKTPEIILKRFSEKLCKSAAEAMKTEEEEGEEGEEGDDSTTDTSSIFPRVSKRESRRLFVNTAIESAMEEYYKDDTIFDELHEILATIEGEDVKEKLKEFRKEFLGKIKQCGLYSFMLRGIQCLMGGMSLTDSLYVMIEAALKGMDIDGMHKLFVGLPLNAQLEIEEKVKEKLAERLADNQDIYAQDGTGFVGGLFGTAMENPYNGAPFIITGPTAEGYKAGPGWYQIKVSTLTGGPCSPPGTICDTSIMNPNVGSIDSDGAYQPRDVATYESHPEGYWFTESTMKSYQQINGSYEQWVVDYSLQANGSFMDQIRANGTKQTPNFSGEELFGNISSDIGKELQATSAATKPTATRRTLAPSRSGGAYNAAGGDSIPGIIITAYIEAILEYYTTSGTLEELLESLQRFPGAEIVFRVLKQLDCSVPPLFDPGVPDFLKSLDIAVCRSQRKLVIPKFQNPKAWLSELDPLAYLKEVIIDRIETIIWDLMVALVKKLMEVVGNALCKALELVGTIVKEAFTPGEASLRSIIQEVICGSEATEEDIDQTIADIFNSIGGAESTANTDAVNSLVNDLSNGLTRNEMTDLLIGRSNQTATKIAKEIIDQEHTEFSAVYSSESKIANLFGIIGKAIPAEYLDILDHLDERDTPLGGMPVNTANCLSSEQKRAFDQARAGILDGKGESKEFINELVAKENEQAIKDLSDLSGVMQKGLGSYIAENMPDIMAKTNCDIDTGRAIIAAVPKELVAINDEIMDKMFQLVFLQLMDDLVGKKGFLSLVLSDTLGNNYPEHIRKVSNQDDYVNSFRDSEDSDRVSVNREKGYHPFTIATWLAQQILKNTAFNIGGMATALSTPHGGGPWSTNGMSTTSQSEVSAILSTGETITATVPEEQNYNLRLEYQDNNDGQGSTTYAGIAADYDYGFYLDYYQSVVAVQSGVKYGTAPGTIPNAVVTDDISRIKITEFNPNTNSVKYDFYVMGSLDEDVSELKATFDLSEDTTVDTLGGTANASTNLSTSPQSYVFSQYVDGILSTVGMPSLAAVLRNSDFNYVSDKFVSRLLQSIAINPSDETYGLTPAFIYGKEIGELTDIDLVYVKPDADVYSSNTGADEVSSEDLYNIEEELQILGRSATDPGDGSSRVHFLDPAKYGGRYNNPPIYIGPPKNTGWLAFAKGVMPELDGCEPSKAQLINFNDIKERVNELLQSIPDDERLSMNPDCVTEVPYARIMNSSAIAGIEGSILATIRIYVAEHMVKAMATFSKFQIISPDVFDDTFVQYIIAVMEGDLKEYGKKIGPLKDDGYWLSFLEQATQATGRMVESEEMEIIDGSAEDIAIVTIEDMQDIYVYPGRDEWLGKTRSGLMFNETVITAALIAGGLLLPGVGLLTALGAGLISGALTGGKIADSVNEYMLKNNFDDDVPPWYADRLQIGSKLTLKAYRETKKLLYIENTQDSAKVLLGRLVKDQMKSLAQTFRDQMYLYEPKLTAKIHDITKHFIGTSKMCYGSSLRADLFNYDDPDPITGEYAAEYSSAAYDGVGDVLDVAAWAGDQTGEEVKSEGRTNPLDGLELSELCLSDFADTAVEDAPYYKYADIIYGINPSEVDPTSNNLASNRASSSDEETIKSSASTVLGGYSFKTGEFIVEKYIYVEDKIEAGMQFDIDANYPNEIIDRATYLRNVVNLSEFSAYLKGDQPGAAGFPVNGTMESPNGIPDVDYGYGLIGGANPVIDPEALISDYFGNLRYIYDDADVDQATPTGIEGSIGLRYGLRISYIPSKDFVTVIEQHNDGTSSSDPTGEYKNILSSEGLRDAAQRYKAFLLESPSAFELGVDVNNLEFNDRYQAIAMSSKYLIPLVSAEIDVIDGPIGEFSINNYDMACLVDKLVQMPEFKLLFKYAFPLNRFLSIVGIYNSEGFLPSIGQITENYRSTDADGTGVYGWRESDKTEATDPRTVGEWDSNAHDGTIIQSNWDRWDKTAFESTKKSLRDMFLAFYNERDFDYKDEFERRKLVDLLKDMGIGGLMNERMKWRQRKRVKDRPFNSQDEACDVYKLT